MTESMPMERLPLRLGPASISLFLDVDGTLLDLAPRPDEVVVADSLLADLAAAEQALDGALALVSGRPIAELDRLFAPLRLRAAGTHGAELRRRPDGSVETASEDLGDEAWRALNRLLREFPDSYAENKGVSFAVHYPDPGTDIPKLADALTDLMTRIGGANRDMRLIAGHAVFEIQRCGFDKGRAIARFMAEPPFRGRRPVFIADDAIDRPGFDKVLSLGGLAYSVGITLPGLSGIFSGPSAVRAWLHGLAASQWPATQEELSCPVSS
jgi:trehalose 6-phosphate phosphatase